MGVYCEFMWLCCSKFRFKRREVREFMVYIDLDCSFVYVVDVVEYCVGSIYLLFFFCVYVYSNIKLDLNMGFR